MPLDLTPPEPVDPVELATLRDVAELGTVPLATAVVVPLAVEAAVPLPFKGAEPVPTCAAAGSATVSEKAAAIEIIRLMLGQRGPGAPVPARVTARRLLC
ncbi:MAG TPA: hypothetical protein VET89_02235 [Stellaceae bacterium]|nr:hypothetical protein [Stellaceae bacterium]